MALYALAWAGGSIAYVPLLTVLLPVRVTTLAGPGAVDWLAYLAFGGALAASVANIAGGWLSDLTHNRRGWIAAGLVGSCALLPWFGRTQSFEALLALMVAWQLALNLMLAPLAAWASDCVPDTQKGTLGGLLSFAPAAGAAAGALVTHPGLASPNTRLALVAVMVALAVLPLLVLGRPRPVAMQLHAANRPEGAPTRESARPLVRMWLARLLVQVAEAALFAYLYLWLQTLNPAFGDATAARLFLVVLTVAIPVTLIAGRWSDRTDRPLAALRLCALLAATGLAGMALAPEVNVALAAYALFALVTAVFLALHSAQTLRVLGRSAARGRDLGIFNLTNTVPSLVMPWLTLALVPRLGFAALFSALALLATGAAALLFSIREKAQA